MEDCLSCLILPARHRSFGARVGFRKREDHQSWTQGVRLKQRRETKASNRSGDRCSLCGKQERPKEYHIFSDLHRWQPDGVMCESPKGGVELRRRWNKEPQQEKTLWTSSTCSRWCIALVTVWEKMNFTNWSIEGAREKERRRV